MAARPTADRDPAARLREARDRFITIWGQMGSTWGIARTMAEVHALLFIEGRPLSADDVVERLGISRGNVSMTLRSLVDWGIVSKVHTRGDRREYFEAEQDLWKMFRTIARERKKRELDPVLEALHDCRAMTADAPDVPTTQPPQNGATGDELAAHNARLDEMLAFLRMVDGISQRFMSPAGEGLEEAARLLARAS